MAATPTATRSSRVLALALSLGLGGCAYGKEVSPVEMPPVAGSTQGRLIVTDFYSGEHQVSQTHSTNIVLLRESMKVRDISPEVAAELTRRGIAAVAKKSWDVDSLEEGETLLRGIRNTGGAKMNRKDVGKYVGKIIAGSLTVFVIGGIISWGHGYHCNVDYRVELVGSNGDYMLATPELPYTESYKTYGWSGRSCDELGVGESANENFYDALAGALRST